jgi:hypothetical protein
LAVPFFLCKIGNIYQRPSSGGEAIMAPEEKNGTMALFFSLSHIYNRKANWSRSFYGYRLFDYTGESRP